MHESHHSYMYIHFFKHDKSIANDNRFRTKEWRIMNSHWCIFQVLYNSAFVEIFVLGAMISMCVHKHEENEDYVILLVLCNTVQL